MTKLIFVTPVGVTNLTGEAWVTDIHKEFGYDLAIMSREDIITSLMDPANASLPQSQLGLQVPIEGPEAETIEKIRAATADVASAWFARLPSRHLLEPRARQLDRDGRDTGEVLSLDDIRSALWKSDRIVLEGAAGRGKTTTLIQLALSGSAGISLLVDLPAWARSGLDILPFVAGMRQFQSRGKVRVLMKNDASESQIKAP